jgi:hypothetical protein
VRGLPAVTQHWRNLSPDPFRVLNDMVRPQTQDTPAFALHRGARLLRLEKHDGRRRSRSRAFAYLVALVVNAVLLMLIAIVAWRTRTAPHA